LLWPKDLQSYHQNRSKMVMIFSKALNACWYEEQDFQLPAVGAYTGVSQPSTGAPPNAHPSALKSLQPQWLWSQMFVFHRFVSGGIHAANFYFGFFGAVESFSRAVLELVTEHSVLEYGSELYPFHN
jgi:hypothetical protein